MPSTEIYRAGDYPILYFVDGCSFFLCGLGTEGKRVMPWREAVASESVGGFRPRTMPRLRTIHEDPCTCRVETKGLSVILSRLGRSEWPMTVHSRET